LATGGWGSAPDSDLLLSYTVLLQFRNFKAYVVRTQNILPPGAGVPYTSYATGNMTSWNEMSFSPPQCFFSSGATTPDTAYSKFGPN